MVLLLPLCQVLAWLLMPIVKGLETVLISSFLLIMYGLYYYQRVISPSELYFFWVPLVIAGIYGWLFLPIPNTIDSVTHKKTELTAVSR